MSCRSVKLLDGLQEDDDTRDIWWQDIRREVRSHARSKPLLLTESSIDYSILNSLYYYHVQNMLIIFTPGRSVVISSLDTLRTPSYG